MTQFRPTTPRMAIACGGTGGHFFPGLAVARELVRRHCVVTLLVSPKAVDRLAARIAGDMEIVTLPSVGLRQGGHTAFVRGFIRSYRVAKHVFEVHPPRAVLAMGGFTSAPPVVAAKRLGSKSFLHESNTIPGRANRWLSWIADWVFAGFPSAASRLHCKRIMVTGTPVRPEFCPRDAATCRAGFGLDPTRPVLLVMGGSQGASGVNSLIIKSLPLLARLAPDLQYLHLTGPADERAAAEAYLELSLRATVHPFLNEMELAFAAATIAVSRAGASALAELAAMRVPAVLVPYPVATDDHQLHNARAFVATGAARLLEQRVATAESLSCLLADLVQNGATREQMQTALALWHAPHAAEQIAETMLSAIGATEPETRGVSQSPLSGDAVQKCRSTDSGTAERPPCSLNGCGSSLGVTAASEAGLPHELRLTA